MYDIHSPRVPGVAEIEELLRRAVAALPVRQVWVNPDCGPSCVARCPAGRVPVAR